MKHVLHTLLFVLLLSITYKAAAQNGKISGQVIDKLSGETIIGGVVRVDGTQLATVTDIEGRYLITNVPTGTYSLTVNFIGYRPQQMNSIVVNNNATTQVDFSLNEDLKELKEVEVVAKISRSSVSGMLTLQKNNIALSDVFSSEQMKKNPDRNSSDVLKRISGISIQENKFVVVRGLNDRYNTAYLNGAPLPSSEPDRKAFSFDMFPANLLDNIVVIKSATPEMPGDFAGGVIQINTRNIPDSNFNSLSISSGYNTLSTGKSFTSYSGGKTDFVGLDDGTRALSKDLPSTNEFQEFTPAQKGEAAKLMKNDWALLEERASAPLSFQYTNGRITKLGKNRLGTILALTYNNSNKIATIERNKYEDQSNGVPVLQRSYTDKEYTKQVLAGALANFAYTIGANSEITFKNMYNINTEDKVLTREGVRDLFLEPGYRISEKSNAMQFTQNQLYTGQFGGEHYLKTSEIKVKWTVGYSDIKRIVPDLRRMIYEKPDVSPDALPGDPVPEYTAAINITGTTPSSGGSIFSSENNEKIYSANYDFSKPFKLGQTKNNIKIGGFHQIRDREFTSRTFGYTRYQIYGFTNPVKFDTQLLQLSQDSIFANENMGLIGPKKGGFKLEEATKQNDKYTASSQSNAGYLMLDNQLFEKLRIIWGVRVESYQQKLSTNNDDGSPSVIDTSTIDFLPSANLIFSPNQQSNIRVCYSKTVSRPEFRELASFGYFDFLTNYSRVGNPTLERAQIDNFDLKYEYFPGNGQVISATVFYKRFKNAIEQVNSSNEDRLLTFANAPLATNYGLELEYRVNLAYLLGNESEILNGIALFTNAALIKSSVDVSKIVGSNAESRALQGQSPYVLNSGLQYTSPSKKFTFSASLNRVGRRIETAGNVYELDVFESPRTSLDFQVSKIFFKHLELKVNLRDALAQNIVFYQDVDANKTYNSDKDNTIQKSNAARVVSFTLGYAF
jgi:TonB-dependent receptor